jgi:hypothetical protein
MSDPNRDEKSDIGTGRATVLASLTRPDRSISGDELDAIALAQYLRKVDAS